MQPEEHDGKENPMIKKLDWSLVVYLLYIVTLIGVGIVALS